MTTSLQVRKIGEMYFNSHPHEEDDGAGSIPAENYQHFNSHPHEEDDVYRKRTCSRNEISTHILTRRMTTVADVDRSANDISTHILTRRMTLS